MKYSDLTKKEVVKLEKVGVINGCGVDGGIRPPKWLAIFFKDPCNQHDWEYEVGGTESDRIMSNVRFLIYLWSVTLKAKWYTVPIYFVIANLFYFSVKIFGKKHFNHGKKKTKEEIFKQADTRLHK